MAGDDFAETTWTAKSLGSDARTSFGQALRTHAFLQRLVEAGCHVEEAAPSFSFEEAFFLWGRVQAFEFFANIPAPFRSVRWAFRFGLTQLIFGRGLFSAGLSKGAVSSPYGYFEAMLERDRFVREMGDFLGKYDVWVTPSSSTPAFSHRRKGKSIRLDGSRVRYGDAQGMYQCTTALTAHPIVALPIGLSSTNLPIGIQLHAARWNDKRLLEVARQMEACVPPLPLPTLL